MAKKSLKKILSITAAVLSPFIIVFFIFLYGVKGLPMWTVVTSNIFDENNQFYLNDQLMGDSLGFCFVLRDQKHIEVKLKNQEKEEVIIFKNGLLTSSMSKNMGDDLGLITLKANGDNYLQKKFTCNMIYKTVRAS